MMQMNIERVINATGSLLIWLVMILAAVILVGLIVIAVNAIGQGMDLCQYFEHKKLKGYADFFNSSSSFCCGVI